MILAAVFRPEAEADVLQTYFWYEQQQVGLGETFAEAVDELISRIEAMPQMYAVVLSEVRRAKLKTFPHLLYYRVFPNRIEVIAVLHGSRDPSIWRDRVN